MAHYLQLKRIFFIVGLLLIAANADAETSIRTLREHGESMNLQMVTLRGVAHLTSNQKQALGGTCAGFRSFWRTRPVLLKSSCAARIAWWNP